jgi:hypothetical protein
MPTATEALGEQSQLKSALDAGVEQLSVQQNVEFRLYNKFVFSQDGFVFWVASPQTMNVSGALHYATDRQQSEDETIATNQVLFTAETPVTEFNAIAPGTMWIGSWPLSPTQNLQVAFASQTSFFKEADLFHYVGFAVYPALSVQIVDSADDLPQGPLVSNSLPIWLALNAMAPVYPSFLVPDNIAPPYIVAHIDPAGTQALAAAPILTWPGRTVPNSGASPMHELASSQLMRDEVDLILYGFTNQQAIQYLWSLIDASLTTANFGFANSPAIQDAKRVQVEIAALAQKKTIHVSANYYQSAADAMARRLILSAFVSSITEPGGVAPEGQAALVQDGQVVNAIGMVLE